MKCLKKKREAAVPARLQSRISHCRRATGANGAKGENHKKQIVEGGGEGLDPGLNG